MARMHKRDAFTLIELLIVVAIIAILAAIAVPNFLEAQLRAKVSRVKADIRTIAVALEAYAVDNAAYPITRLPVPPYADPLGVDGGIGNVPDITTPVAYLTSNQIADPFALAERPYGPGGILYGSFQPLAVSRTIWYANVTAYRARGGLNPVDVHWMLLSFGPDRVRGPIPGANAMISTYCGLHGRTPAQEQYFIRAAYDPTNGTASGGDIFMYQGHGF